MIRMRTWDQARTGRRVHQKDTFDGFVTDFIVADEAAPAQAFLVEQKPNWVTPPHFHLEHQFQVVTAGTGSIGRHEVGPLCVHYATAETGYGPISAGPDGVTYLTMRVIPDSGAWYLHKPGSRERMRRGLKRQQEHGAPKAAVSATELKSLRAPSVEALIPPRENGLAAHLVRMPPDETFTLPAEHAHGGRFYVATGGSMRLGDAELRALSTVFASADETFSIRSGTDGLEVLVLQFSRDALVASPPQDGSRPAPGAQENH
jgi:hypothetical protein